MNTEISCNIIIIIIIIVIVIMVGRCAAILFMIGASDYDYPRILELLL